MKSYIYWIRLPEHNDITTQGYVGVTKSFGKRMITHKSKSESGRTHFHKAIRCYGWDNLIKEVVIVGNYDYCFYIEKKLRPENDIGWNGKIGGSGGWDYVNKNCNGAKLTHTRIKEKGKYDEYIDKLSNGSKRYWSDKKHIDNRSKMFLSLWEDEEYRKKVLLSRKEFMESKTKEERKSIYGDKQRGVPKPNSKEASSIKSNSMKEIWENDELRKQRCESLRGKRKIVVCPHCGLEGGGGNMYRYHFDKCKSYPISNENI